MIEVGGGGSMANYYSIILGRSINMITVFPRRGRDGAVKMRTHLLKCVSNLWTSPRINVVFDSPLDNSGTFHIS